MPPQLAEILERVKVDKLKESQIISDNFASRVKTLPEWAQQYAVFNDNLGEQIDISMPKCILFTVWSYDKNTDKFSYSIISPLGARFGKSRESFDKIVALAASVYIDFVGVNNE